MRNLAQKASGLRSLCGQDSDPADSATLRVYERLRQVLVSLLELLVFGRSLLAPGVGQNRSSWPKRDADLADGALQNLARLSIDRYRRVQDGDSVWRRGIVLIARLLGLLLIFIGDLLR